MSEENIKNLCTIAVNLYEEHAEEMSVLFEIATTNKTVKSGELVGPLTEFNKLKSEEKEVIVALLKLVNVTAKMRLKENDNEIQEWTSESNTKENW